MAKQFKGNLNPIPEVGMSGSFVGKAIAVAEKYLILPESREPMKLHPYQRDLFEQWTDSNSLAHMTVIGAGNTKTTTLSAYVVACMFLTDEASIPVVASTVQQAVLTTWGRAKRFIELSPELLERSEILEGQGSRRGIFVPGMAGHCFPIADRPDGLQGLMPGPVTILEETSEASVATFSALMSRMGKRPGKVVGISTPSFTPDNALLQVQRAMKSGEPMPGVTLTEYVSDQEDHRDVSQWYKANPALAHGVLDVNALHTALAVLPEQQFRCYRLCQNPTGSEACWLNSVDEKGDEKGDGYDIWKTATKSHRFTEGQATWIGVDVAKSGDHAAITWAQFADDGRLHIKCKIITPSKTHDIDLEEVADFIRNLCGLYAVQEILFDPSFFFNHPMLAAEGLPMVEALQSEKRMAPIIAYTYAEFRRGRITHDEDPQFELHVLSAKRKYCAYGWTLEKRDFAKIDGAIAMCLAHEAATGGTDISIDNISALMKANAA